MLTFHTNFSVSALYREQRESLKGFLQKRWSFWLALFSCIAFLIGNMVGQHGFQAFWKSVWGKEQVVFEGTMYPLADIPQYIPSSRCSNDATKDRRVFSVGYLGDYDNGSDQCGSHPGIDILTALGTPVYAVANGIVQRIEERNYGYGNTIVIEHPDVPDSADPRKTTTLYSGYAHLGRILVTEGSMVRKGEQIAVSGQTGFATAPHLHFQIDTALAPFHPYWPFTNAEAAKANLSFVEAVNEGLGQTDARRYTVNPLVYVEEFLKGGTSPQPIYVEDDGGTTVADSGTSSSSIHILLTWKEKVTARRTAKREMRLAKREETKTLASRVAEVASPDVVALPPTSSAPVVPETPLTPTAVISMLHDGSFEERATEQLVLFARDSAGNFLQRVEFAGKITLETAFGQEEFSPAELTAASFDDRGRAFVTIIPRGKKTIIPAVRGAFTVDGEPMALRPSGVNTTSAETQPQGG